MIWIVSRLLQPINIIEKGIKGVVKGDKNADQTAKALEGIVIYVEKVNDIIGLIVVTSDGQSQMITQINQGISDLNEVVQQKFSVVPHVLHFKNPGSHGWRKEGS